MEQGWVKLHRQIAENSFLMHDDRALLVFIKLLVHVNKKGEISAGRRQLGQLFNINDRTLYDVLVRLENQGIIAITSNAKYSIFRIKNWSKYQANANRGDIQNPTASPTAKKQIRNEDLPTAAPTRAQPEPNHKPTTAQHSNKNKKENKKHLVDDFSELKLELGEFVKMRRTIRKPITQHGITLVVKKLQAMYPDDVNSQIASLNQSIENSWQGVFELKQPVIAKSKKSIRQEYEEKYGRR